MGLYGALVARTQPFLERLYMYLEAKLLLQTRQGSFKILT